MHTKQSIRSLTIAYNEHLGLLGVSLVCQESVNIYALYDLSLASPLPSGGFGGACVGLNQCFDGALYQVMENISIIHPIDSFLHVLKGDISVHVGSGGRGGMA